MPSRTITVSISPEKHTTFDSFVKNFPTEIRRDEGGVPGVPYPVTGSGDQPAVRHREFMQGGFEDFDPETRAFKLLG